MNQEKTLTTEETLDRILYYAMEKKAEDITVIDLRGISSVSDYFVIVSGTSTTQVKAIADEVRDKMKKEHNMLPWHMEGYEAQKWILVDFVDVVVHVFDPETREYFNLENLWKDADIKRIATDY